MISLQKNEINEYSNKSVRKIKTIFHKNIEIFLKKRKRFFIKKKGERRKQKTKNYEFYSLKLFFCLLTFIRYNI